MSFAKALPAKLIRPRLFDALRRSRLFDLLAASNDHVVTWLSGLPGSGKTFLAASWIETNNTAALWYHVDSTDSDAGTLFHYLTVAARAFLPDREMALSPYSPEYAVELERYSRLFFRELAAHLPDKMLFVFDDYHTLEPDSPVHRALAVGFEELVGRAHVLVVSRCTAPPAFMRLLAEGKLVLQGNAALRFTESETAEVLKACGVFDAATSRRIHDQTQGWAAGLRLILSGCEANAPSSVLDGNDHAVFGYFAAEIWQTLPSDMQNMLLVTSVPPYFSERMAMELIGSTSVRQWLDDLYRRNLFITRRGEDNSSHRYHDLFRSFLLSRARREFSPEQWRGLNLRAAELMIAAGHGEEAILLLRSVQAWTEARNVIKILAPTLLAHGRALALVEAFDALPSDMPADPWATYWRAAALTSTSPVKARELFESCHLAFRLQEDTFGALMSAAAVADGHFLEYGDVSSLKRWIPILDQHLFESPIEISDSDLLAVSASALLAMLFCAPDHPRLRRCIQNCLALAAKEFDPNRKVRACTALLAYSGFAFDIAIGRTVISLIANMSDISRVTDVNRYRWHDFKSYLHFVMGEFEEEEGDVQKMEALAARVPIGVSPMSVFSDRLHSALARGKIDTARAIQEKMEVSLDPRCRTDIVFASCARAWVNLYLRRYQEVVREGEDLAAILDAHQFVLHQCLHRIPWILALSELGRHDEARDVLVMAKGAIESTCLAGFVTLFFWVEAIVECNAGRRALMREALRAALGRARQFGHGAVFNRLRYYIGLLLQVAASERIEVSTVQSLADHFDWLPEAAQPPIQVRSRAGFEVWIDGAPLTFNRKAMQRPLALLKLLAAQPEEAVPLERIADELWPDADGDHAHGALESTLTRLRRLLGYNDAILRTGGRLRLNPVRVVLEA